MATDPFKSLGLTKLTKGTMKVPGVKKKLPTYMVVGGIALLAVAGYMYTSGGLGGAGGVDKDVDAPLVDVADTVDFEVIPDEVRPNSYVTAVGLFKMNDGKAVSVPEGYYYVFEDIGVNGRELRARGSLGRNVSRFSQNIPTPNFRQGRYTILITDTPLSEQEIGPINLGTGPYGAGVEQGSPTGSLNVPQGTRPVAVS